MPQSYTTTVAPIANGLYAFTDTGNAIMHNDIYRGETTKQDLLTQYVSNAQKGLFSTPTLTTNQLKTQKTLTTLTQSSIDDLFETTTKSKTANNTYHTDMGLLYNN